MNANKESKPNNDIVLNYLPKLFNLLECRILCNIHILSKTDEFFMFLVIKGSR
jgi:hypothetical protein